MFKLTVAVTGIVLLLGCTSKEERSLMDSYTKNINYHKQLQKTEKTQLYENNVTKVMMTATYLYTPTEDKNDTRDETFIVGIHLENEASEELNYGLLLNGTKAKEVEELSTDDARLKELSFISEWGEYYLVTFPHVKSKKVTLVFESDRYGKGKLYFAKVAKYILTKQAF
ncbi:MAG: hypothetical protein DRG09_04530 [Epsilonproteobacteria bacterium]|nr:MAG: hypothetical protein DRG09_04530 [Campylobacterota bacterium]